MDELERLRARNAELEAALAKGAPNLVTRPEPPTFKRSDLRDAAFFAAHRKDILDAASHGRIIDDLPAKNLDSAIAAHYAAPPTPEQHRQALERRAFRFQRDPSLEQEIATRAVDPKFYDAEMRRVGVDAGPRIFYEDARAAALELNPDALKEGN
jgi:hypothetical protein